MTQAEIEDQVARIRAVYGGVWGEERLREWYQALASRDPVRCHAEVTAWLARELHPPVPADIVRACRSPEMPRSTRIDPERCSACRGTGFVAGEPIECDGRNYPTVRRCECSPAPVGQPAQPRGREVDWQAATKPRADLDG